jgi:hypothetical protein
VPFNVSRVATFLVALALFSTIETDAAEPDNSAPRRPLTFPQIVEANFVTWDRDGDGQLSAGEINALVISPVITGRTAAAVAAVHRYFRDNKTRQSLGKDDLLRGPAANSILSFFGSSCRHIAGTSRTVFAEDCLPAINAVSQGGLGDCYFISAVGAALRRDSNVVRDMVQPQPDGSANVQFPRGPKVHVRQLTDAEIALTSTADNQGIWLNVLEKAYGQVSLRTANSKQSANDLDVDVIARGGNARLTITLLTGHKSALINIRKSKGRAQPPGAAELPALRNEVDELLKSRIRKRALLVAGTSDAKMPAGIVSNHDYAIIGYDAPRRVVRLWNPQGQPSGMGRDYATNRGFFQLSLDDFLQIFTVVFYETDEAVAKRSVH